MQSSRCSQLVRAVDRFVKIPPCFQTHLERYLDLHTTFASCLPNLSPAPGCFMAEGITWAWRNCCDVSEVPGMLKGKLRYIERLRLASVGKRTSLFPDGNQIVTQGGCWSWAFCKWRAHPPQQWSAHPPQQQHRQLQSTDR